MRHWNYRLCKQIVSGYTEYSFREVHYNNNDDICGYSLVDHNPLVHTMDDEIEEDVKEELKLTLQKMLECMEKSVVDLDFVDSTFK